MKGANTGDRGKKEPDKSGNYNRGKASTPPTSPYKGEVRFMEKGSGVFSVHNELRADAICTAASTRRTVVRGLRPFGSAQCTSCGPQTAEERPTSP